MMTLSHLIAALLLLLTFIPITPAQLPAPDSAPQREAEAAKKERDKKALAMLDEVIKESESVRLPENRARLEARAGDLLWSRDEKRARVLLKEAIDNFIEFSRRAEQKQPRPGMDWRPWPTPGVGMNFIELGATRMQLRQELLDVLAQHEPRWARDFLEASRTPGGLDPPRGPFAGIDDTMEAQLAVRLAGSDPAQALDMVTSKLDRYLSAGQGNMLIQILKQMHGKDAAAAAKLAADVVERIRAANLGENAALARLTCNLLEAATEAAKSNSSESPSTLKPEAPLLSETTLKDMADRVASAVLAQRISNNDEDEDDSPLLDMAQTMLPIIEKYAPARAGAVRAKINDYIKTLNPQAQAYATLASRDGEVSLDAVLEAAAKAPPEVRDQFYIDAAYRAIGAGETDRARQIIDEHVSNAQQRAVLMAQLERGNLMNAAQAGKIEEAQQMLAQVEAPEERARILAQLAAAIAMKGDKKTAVRLLNDARGQFGASPENAAQFDALLQIASGYAASDAPQGFDVLEGMSEKLTSLISACAALDGFEGRQQFRDGELVLQGQGLASPLVQGWGSALELLSSADIDRARALTARFERTEVRLLLRTMAVAGVLRAATNLPLTSPRFTHFTTPFSME
jgi:hypothetical protein